MAEKTTSFEHTITQRLNVLRSSAAEDAPVDTLVLFLHGSGERGSDIELLRSHSSYRLLHDSLLAANAHTLLIAPQCPDDTIWENHLETLHALVTGAVTSHSIAADRVRITGNSMGGMGVWSMCATYPHLFSRAMPVCPADFGLYNLPERASSFAHVRVWAFHGADDYVVPVTDSERMISLLDGDDGDDGDAQLTVLSGVGHNAWDATYTDRAAIDWLTA